MAPGGVRGWLARATATLLVVPMLSAAMAARALADDVDFTIPAAADATLSGIATDTSSNLYWMVKNPTSSEFLAVQGTGAVVGDLVIDAPVSNVQALSYRQGTLYIGDIGGTREEVQVFAVDNPATGKAVPTQYTFRYPDGAHDAAAMMLSPRGNIYIATLGPDPAFYRPSQAPIAGETVTLTRVALAPEGISDGTFLSDGQNLAVRTPIGVQLINAFSFERAALGPTPDQVVGDSLAEGLERGVLMVGYGGAVPRVSVMQYPIGFETSSPTPSATPTPTPSASPSTEPISAAPTAPPSAVSGARGTLVSIGIAAGVAVLAGALTLIGRRSST